MKSAIAWISLAFAASPVLADEPAKVLRHLVGSTIDFNYTFVGESRDKFDDATLQAWVERLGDDAEIPAIPKIIGRRGRLYGAGGERVHGAQNPRKDAVRETISRNKQLDTTGFPSGRYRYAFEFTNYDGPPDRKSFEFELVDHRSFDEAGAPKASGKPLNLWCDVARSGASEQDRATALAVLEKVAATSKLAKDAGDRFYTTAEWGIMFHAATSAQAAEAESVKEQRLALATLLIAEAKRGGDASIIGALSTHAVHNGPYSQAAIKALAAIDHPDAAKVLEFLARNIRRSFDETGKPYTAGKPLAVWCDTVWGLGKSDEEREAAFQVLQKIVATRSLAKRAQDVNDATYSFGELQLMLHAARNTAASAKPAIREHSLKLTQLLNKALAEVESADPK